MLLHEADDGCSSVDDAAAGTGPCFRGVVVRPEGEVDRRAALSDGAMDAMGFLAARVVIVLERWWCGIVSGRYAWDLRVESWHRHEIEHCMKTGFADPFIKAAVIKHTALATRPELIHAPPTRACPLMASTRIPQHPHS